MAAEKLALVIVSPERLERETQVDMVVVPGSDGDFGVLPNHAPLMSALRPGVVCIFEDGKVIERLFVGDGFVEVNREGCTILAETSCDVSSLDGAQLEQQITDLAETAATSNDETVKNAASRNHALAKAQLEAVRNPQYH